MDTAIATELQTCVKNTENIERKTAKIIQHHGTEGKENLHGMPWSVAGGRLAGGMLQSPGQKQEWFQLGSGGVPGLMVPGLGC